ncbi:MAG TPA: zinc/iron-chelating domain-containing protein [Spirochaeta sp.]|nr:zinc/iron-chelating domain-containing protein [Spirochaeta sp.]
MSNNKFYENGLQFECQRCSACCRHDPGYVFLTKKDLETLAAEKSMSEDTFLNKYCRIIDLGGFKRISLVEKSNYDCIFWSEDGCEVYKARPVQCRTYPFWISYLEEETEWKELASSCPGVGKGPIVSKEEIEKRIAERQDEQMLTV